MRLASALLAVAVMPLAVVAGVQRAETPEVAGLAEALAIAYGLGALVLWLAAEVTGWRAGGRR
jgi:hypothetical protein